MKLKIEGKLRDGFFEWYTYNYGELGSSFNKSFFRTLPNSAQFGLLQEYADTLGYDVVVKRLYYQRWFYYEIKDTSVPEVIKQTLLLASRPEAQVAAIEKLNEIINKDER